MNNNLQKKCLSAILFLGILLGVNEMRAAETEQPSNAAATLYTVTFSVNGEETHLKQASTGATVTSVVVTDRYDYKFVGWTDAQLGTIDVENKPNIVCKPGDNYTPKQNITLYAVFGRNGKERDEGELLIYADVNGTKYYMAATSLPITGIDHIRCSQNRNFAVPFMVNNSSSGKYTISYKANGLSYYLCPSGTGNNILTSSSASIYSFSRTNGNNGKYQYRTEDKRSIMFDNEKKYFKFFAYSESSSSTRYFDLNLESVLYTTKFTYDLTISEVGYATLCLPFNATKPSGVQVFTARHENGRVLLEECPSGKIRAGEGYIVKAVPGKYTFVATEDEVAVLANNSLVGVTETETLQGDGTIFIFDIQNGVVGFSRLVDKGSLSKNKAYLKINEPLASRNALPLN